VTAAFVRRMYRVTFKRGDRVVLHDHAACTAPDVGRCEDTAPDLHGVIVSFPGQYVGVRFDGEKRTSRCHPTWRLFAEEPAETLVLTP